MLILKIIAYLLIGNLWLCVSLLLLDHGDVYCSKWARLFIYFIWPLSMLGSTIKNMYSILMEI